MRIMKALFFILPYLALVLVTFLPWLRLEKRERRFLLILSAFALFLHTIFALCMQKMPVARYGPFFFIDEYGYDKYSWGIAREWRSGNFPNLWTDQYLGTLHTGWNRILAAIYYVFGHHPRLGIALNILAGALLTPLAFFTTRELFREAAGAAPKENLANAIPPQKIKAMFPLSPEFIAALIATVHLSFAYWSSFLLRDTILAVMFLASLYLILTLHHRMNLWNMGALILILLGLALLRVYSVGFLLAGPFVYLLFIHKKKGLFWIALAAGMLFLLAGRIYIPLRDYEDQLVYSFLNNLPDAGNTPLGSLIHFLRGLPRFFLGPYAWYVSPGPPVIDYMLYPGQWILYLLILPFALKGIFLCMRENIREALYLVIPCMLSMFLFLLAYGGSVPRQRLYLEPIFVIFAAWGLSRKDRARRVPLLWYGFLVLFIAAHSLSAWKRGLW